MANIFISGIAGFLGSHLADAFIAQGHHVIGIDNLTGGYRDNVPEKAEFYACDCNDLATVMACMEDSDVVYHCAAAAYEGLSIFSPHFVTRNIVTATSAMISAAVRNRVKRFINLSSMSRYGSNAVPFTEDMLPSPQDPYGIGKWASELLVRNLAEVHGMEWVIAVPHNIIGPRQKYDDPYRNVASIFINLMLQGRQPFVYGDGEQMRCFSFISDVVAPLVRMATDAACVSQVINVGPDDEFITINHLAERIAALLNFPLQIQHLPARPQEVRLANCSAGKARRLLDYQPQIPLDEGLLRMIDYVEQRGVKPFEYHLPLEIINEQTPETWKGKLL